MATSELQKIPLWLTTVTPVSIGDDEAKTLSPYADYVFSEDGKHLLYLNQDVIQRRFMQNGQPDKALLDEYVQGIGDSMDNNRSKFDLREFLKTKLRLPLDGEVVRRKVPVAGLQSKIKQQIRPIAKSAGQIYLPGSSIKGAIRTAVLYDWLVKTQAGEGVMKKLSKTLEAVAELQQKNPNPRRMSWEARQEMRKMEDVFFPEHDLFGSLKSKGGPDARRIRVSDTNTTQQGLQVMALKRIRLTPNPRGGSKTEIPIPREAFFSAESLRCAINVLPGFESPVLRYWEEKSPAEILELLNGFTLDALANEIYELENAHGGDFGEEVDDLLAFYQTLRNRAKSGEVFLRIGFGKTIYDNSLALSILNGISDEKDAQDAFDTFRRSFWRMNRHAQTYPATRTVTPGNLPLGWVKMEAVG